MSNLNLQISETPLFLRDTGSYVDIYGVCRQRDSSEYLHNVRRWWDEAQSKWTEDERIRLLDEKKKFINELYEKYKISISMVKVSNAQNEYILSWSPDDLPEGSSLTVAIEHCFLAKNENSTKLDPAWNVDGNRVPYPHPLIFERTEFRESIDVKPSRRIMAHYTQFYGDNTDKFNKLPVTNGVAFSGYAFHHTVKNCNASDRIVAEVRKYMVREVNITLKN